ARAPNIKWRDWPLRKIGARIHCLGHAAKHPIWRGLLPNRIDCPTEDVVIDLVDRDALNCCQPVRGEYDVVVRERHYLTLDMSEPGIQSDIFASPPLSEDHHRQFESARLENTKAIIVAAVVHCNHLPPTCGWLQTLQRIEHTGQGMRAIVR